MTEQAFKDSVRRYVDQKVRPGRFVRAVLANDLFSAVQSADPESLQLLPTFMDFVYNEIPSNVWGSYHVLADHLSMQTEDVQP